jgi:hypothetical protein
MRVLQRLVIVLNGEFYPTKDPFCVAESKQRSQLVGLVVGGACYRQSQAMQGLRLGVLGLHIQVSTEDARETQNVVEKARVSGPLC